MSSPPSPVGTNHSTTSDAAPSRHTSTSHTSTLVDDSGSLLDSRYECPICIHWLKEPVLTSCGHRFCKPCIYSWLENKNQRCPIDNKILSPEHDIFPDNYIRREIDQIKSKCPNSPLGCDVVSSPHEVDKHLLECPYKLPSPTEVRCPFAKIKCTFVSTKDGPTVQEHIESDMAQHINLILEKMEQQSLADWTPPEKVSNGHTASALPPPPAQYANEADENLIAAMYQRIVVLEQRCQEKDVQIENITKRIVAREKTDHMFDGVLVWEISNFTSLVDAMRMNINMRFYSRECYTSPHGYKFCGRINVHKMDHLSLHVHLMHSENDFHLDWPFNGRLKFSMIHPKGHHLSQHDTIMSKSDFLAFHRPNERISPRGFGFLEYANIADVFRKGFIENDRLVLKIQVNIV